MNKPVENPALVAAIADLQKNNTPAARARVVEELRQAHFLSPVKITPKPAANEAGQSFIEKGTTVELDLLVRDDNQTFLPVFTDWPELKKWRVRGDEQTLISTYDDLNGMIMRDQKYAGFIINVASSQMCIDRTLMAEINGSVVSRTDFGPHAVEQDTPVRIGIPNHADLPRELLIALVKDFKMQPHIKTAWLVLIERKGSFLLVVNFTGDEASTFKRILQIGTPHLKQNELLRAIKFDPQDKENLSAYVARACEPFYKRKLWGSF